MYQRAQTKTIKVGGIPVGGGHPITIQSMTNTDTRNTEATIRQIYTLAETGCEIIRVAVPDTIAAKAIKTIKKASPIPVVADIHFDYQLALAAIENGADKLRINPGNIGGPDKIRQIAESAKSAGIPIRVGVNGGSLERDLYEKYGGITPEALCESVMRHVKLLEDHSFYDIVLAIKVSDINLTLAAHKLLCQQTNYPIHIGITEAGTPYKGTIKSAAGIGALLAMGIGDTLRVSLTGDPLEEVRVAKEILQSFNLRRFGPKIISCPTCGRCNVENFLDIVKKVEAYCEGIEAPITVAVMGCVVNGPGEGKEADYGIACAGRSSGPGQSGGEYGVIFQKGKIVEKVYTDQLAEALIEIIRSENPFCDLQQPRNF